MLHENHLRYFFSIQPFWDMGRMENFIRSDHISVSEFRWIHDVMSCVPGNGQLGIMLSNPEDFSGYCFGVADCRDEIPLYGMTKGYFIRFSPGAFSAVFKIPSVEIPVYGDNVIEKHGINRDSTGDREKTRYLCGKQGIFTRDRALIRPGFIRQLETRASTRSASFFHALGSPGRPYNGGGEAGAYRTRNGAKPLKQGHLRAKRGPLGPSRKSQQQTKRTGFAAHGHSIAETAPEGKRAKRAKRANGALIRA